MTEEDARLALLQAELNGIQNSIRSLDTVDFQIKGWCVTTGLAVAGFSVAYKKPVLLLVGMAAIVGFYMVNCQFKAIQRAFIRRNRRIDSEIKKDGIMQFLSDDSSLDVAGTAMPEWRTSGHSILRSNIEEMIYEAVLPNTFTLYLFIFICLLAEACILYGR